MNSIEKSTIDRIRVQIGRLRELMAGDEMVKRSHLDWAHTQLDRSLELAEILARRLAQAEQK